MNNIKNHIHNHNHQSSTLIIIQMNKIIIKINMSKICNIRMALNIQVNSKIK